MESLPIRFDAESYDKAVHGGLDELPVLQECGDLQLFVKPRATEQGNAGAVLTFTVVLPDGQRARAQAVTTAALLRAALQVVAGWGAAGRI